MYNDKNFKVPRSSFPIVPLGLVAKVRVIERRSRRSLAPIPIDLAGFPFTIYRR